MRYTLEQVEAQADLVVSNLRYMKCDLVVWKHRSGISIPHEDLRHTPQFSTELVLPFQLTQSLLDYLLTHSIIRKKHRREIGILGRVKLTYCLVTEEEREHYRFFTDSEGSMNLEETSEEVEDE